MFCSFKDVFSKEKEKERLLKVAAWVENDIILHGEACINCDNAIYVQVSPYYDCMRCKKDKAIEIPQYERGIRCDDYKRAKIEVSE